MNPIFSSTKNPNLQALNQGKSYTKITFELGISKNSVRRIESSRENHVTKFSLGRPRKLTDQHSLVSGNFILSEQYDSAIEISKKLNQSLLSPVSPYTVHRILYRAGMKAEPKV